MEQEKIQKRFHDCFRIDSDQLTNNKGKLPSEFCKMRKFCGVQFFRFRDNA